MKKVFRHELNEQYWDRRWSETGQDGKEFASLDIYPIKYAEMVIGKPGEKILEVGCGLGRVIKHYAVRGHDVWGVERSKVAVDRLNSESPDLKVELGSAEALPYPSEMFDVVLAFGVYHNIEVGMEAALSEASRVLRAQGRFCISMRPDNIEMNLNEVLWKWGASGHVKDVRQFHKWLTKPSPFSSLLGSHGLRVDGVYFARNMSILYRIPFLRDRSAKLGTETARRSAGYKLNAVGTRLDAVLRTCAPFQMCNVLVFTGTKGEARA